MNDHDLLVCIDVKLKELKIQFTNHLRHHFAVNIVLLTSTLSLAAAVLVLVIKK